MIKKYLRDFQNALFGKIQCVVTCPTCLKKTFVKPVLEEYCFESALLCQRNRSCVALKIRHVKHFIRTLWLADWTYTSFVGKNYTSDERLVSVLRVWSEEGREMECGKKGGRGEERTSFVLSTHPSHCFFSHITAIADAAADTWQIWRTYLLI